MGDACVYDPMATLGAPIHSEVAHTYSLNRHLPIPLLRMVHRKPTKWGRKVGRIVATQVQLPTGPCQSDAELWQHTCGTLEETTQETARWPRCQTLQAEAHNAIVGHTQERFVIHVNGSKHRHVHTSLTTRTPHANTVAYHDRLDLALTEIRLGESHRIDIAKMAAFR